MCLWKTLWQPGTRRTMLETAHVGAVMCNAFPGVADHGDYVTEHDNNHDGLAEIVRKFILN